MNATQECLPRFRLIPLNGFILCLQWQIACDIYLLETSHPVTVPGREKQWVNIQKVEHFLYGHLGVKFLKHKDFLPVVSVKDNAFSLPVIGDAADLAGIVLFINISGLTGPAGTIEICHL